MMNKVILIGRLGRDPEVRYMPNGNAVCNFSVATDETWNDKATGQRQTRTEWHNITIYQRLAEIAGQYLRKGSLVYLEGRIQSRKYTDKNNVERTAYDIVCSEMKMLESKNSQASQQNYSDFDNAYTAPPQQNYAPAPQPYQAPAEPPSAPTQRRAPAAPVAPVSDIDDDIPF